MIRWIGGALLGALLCFAIDLGATIAQAHLFRSRVGSSEILPALCKRVRPGMTRPEVERELAGFRELRLGKVNGEYAIAYGYWFGFIPPLGRSEIKLIGEIDVSFSDRGRAKKCSYWYN